MDKYLIMLMDKKYFGYLQCFAEMLQKKWSILPFRWF